VAVHPLSIRPSGLTPLAGSGKDVPRRSEGATYPCYLPILGGFAGFRRAGPGLQRHLATSVPQGAHLEREFDPAKRVAGSGHR
jgi:hypothetical protein